jgi:hypothetical protein
VNRLKVQRLESRRKTRDIYKVVGCLMPYRLCALTSAQLKLSSVRFMQQTILHLYLDRESQHRLMSCMRMKTCMKMVAV